MRRSGAAVALLLTLVGCERVGPAILPTPEEARAFYAATSGVDEVRISGNVVVVEVRQPGEQLRRGGSLWAKVGPYIYLLTPGTRELFEQYPDVAAVRVVTFAPGQREVARALLPRDTLSSVQWRRSLNLLGHALKEGTARPSRLEDLVAWGEQYTEHRYNPAFLPN
ncbi:MAG: hypothetical protein ACRELV_01285 [Longimicrobiales bacterium]